VNVRGTSGKENRASKANSGNVFSKTGWDSCQTRRGGKKGRRGEIPQQKTNKLIGESVDKTRIFGKMQEGSCLPRTRGARIDKGGDSGLIASSREIGMINLEIQGRERNYKGALNSAAWEDRRASSSSSWEGPLRRLLSDSKQRDKMLEGVHFSVIRDGRTLAKKRGGGEKTVYKGLLSQREGLKGVGRGACHHFGGSLMQYWKESKKVNYELERLSPALVRRKTTRKNNNTQH